MKPSLSKTQAKEAVDAFFQRASWTSDELKKLKRLAMKHRIKLGAYRKRFCKQCLLPLKGKTRVTRARKSVICKSCGTVNRHVLEKDI